MIKLLKEMDTELNAPSEEWEASNTDTLEKALGLAMATIANASDTVSGKATELLPLPQDRSKMLMQECPYSLPKTLLDKDFCEYQGYYHTDYTIPSEYFCADVNRPAHIQPKGLDFTYLFWDSVENPAFTTMGEGLQVRSDQATDERERSPALSERLDKRSHVIEESVPVEEYENLKRKLGST